jgi:hypothetical protein
MSKANNKPTDLDANADGSVNRRTFMKRSAVSLGTVAFADAETPRLQAASNPGPGRGLPGLPHFQPRAKRVIYLFLAGGPSHIDLFDYKPTMGKIHGTELPESIRQGQRLTTMSSGQSSFPCVAPMFNFERRGERGTWINTDLLPRIASIIDDVAIVRSMHTESINHDPAITYINTGTQQHGRPSFGSWISYGLGSPNRDLPAYVVMISVGSMPGQALYSRLWSSGCLPSRHQGVQFRSTGDPVLYLTDPQGIDRDLRRRMLDGLASLNNEKFRQTHDPEIEARIAQYELAFRMQMSVPNLMDMETESEKTLDMYGPDASKKGTFAANCVLARRLSERGVPFVQLFHRGWDQHGNLPAALRHNCNSVDQPVTALITDLKQRGLLDDTVVIFGGEFGRTIYSQGELTQTNYGRDHHGRCFTTCVVGGGFKPIDYGQTDDYSYNIVSDPVHINDLNATVLHCLGIDHERFSVKQQGLDVRLTGVEGARVISELLA